MYSPDAIAARKRRTPFVPFRIVTADGGAHVVTHPRLIMVGRRDVTVGVAAPGRPDVYERVERLPLADVVEVCDLPPSPA